MEVIACLTLKYTALWVKVSKNYIATKLYNVSKNVQSLSY